MTITADLRAAIVRSVEDGFDDQIAYTQKLVSFASQRGAEFTVQDFIHNDLRARGMTMDRFEMDEAALTAHEGGAPYSTPIPAPRSSSASTTRARKPAVR